MGLIRGGDNLSVFAIRLKKFVPNREVSRFHPATACYPEGVLISCADLFQRAIRVLDLQDPQVIRLSAESLNNPFGRQLPGLFVKRKDDIAFDYVLDVLRPAGRCLGSGEGLRFTNGARLLEGNGS